MFTYRPKIIRNLWCALLLLMIMPSLAFEQENVKVTLNYKNTPIKKVFFDIEAQSGYAFFYSVATLNAESLVNINVKQTSLLKVLDELLKPMNVKYIIHNKSIIIRKNSAPSIAENITETDTLPSFTVSGKVYNSKGEPMPGVSVSVRSRPMSTITDNAGAFQLSNILPNSLLVFSSIGYENSEIKAKRSSVVSITMKELITELNKIDVVSTGYQQIPKERITGSFSQVDNATFNRRVSTNILDRLDDVVSGLLKSNTGDPNPLNKYTIRGITTLNADRKPLLVIDNYIYDGDPNLINPNDVESVTVLKDAAASSIWGVRAGNGVVVITLKKGRNNQKPQISLTTNITIIEKPAISKISSIPSNDIIELEKKRYDAGFYRSRIRNNFNAPLPEAVVVFEKRNRGIISQSEADEEINRLRNNDIRDEIENNFVRNAILQQYALNVTGGDDKYTYYGSIGFDNNLLKEINNKNNRLNLRYANSWKLHEKLTLNGEINWTKSQDNKKNLLDPNFTTILTAPYNTLKNKNGTIAQHNQFYLDTANFPGMLNWDYSPVNEAKNGNIINQQNTINLLGGLEFQIIEGLKANVQYQWFSTQSESKNIMSQETFQVRNSINSFITLDPISGIVSYPYPKGSTYIQSNGTITSWNFRTRIDYSKIFKDHSISVVGGFDTRESTTEQITTYGFGFNPETYTFNSFKTGSWYNRITKSFSTLAPPPPYKTGLVNRFASYFGIATYSYNSRYTINASARIDQSNFFGVKSNDRIVPLWSIGSAWTISNENWYGIQILPMLRFRATYGYSGNVTPGVTPFVTGRYELPRYPLNRTYIQLTNPPNPILRWEKVRQINAGIDYSFKNQIISGSIDYYKKYGIDLIGPIESAPSTGFSSYSGNRSAMISQGVDVSIHFKKKIERFQISTHAIFSYNTNKVTKYDIPLPQSFYAPSGYTGNTIPIVGKPIDKIYRYKWAGLDGSDGSSRLIIDGKIAGSSDFTKAKFSDYVFKGRTTPAYFGTLRPDVEWNNWSISLALTYRFKYVFQRYSFSGTISPNNSFEHSDYLNRWQNPGDETSTNVPGFLDSQIDNRYHVYTESDILIEKGDHIKFQDLRIGYNLRRTNAKWLPFINVNIYSYINNLGIIWKASKYNPEYQYAFIAYPIQKSYTLGLNISF